MPRVQELAVESAGSGQPEEKCSLLPPQEGPRTSRPPWWDRLASLKVRLQHPLRVTAAHMLTPPVGFCGFFEDTGPSGNAHVEPCGGPAPGSRRGFWERGSLPGPELASMVSSASGGSFVQDSPTPGTQALHTQRPLPASAPGTPTVWGSTWLAPHV